MAAPSQLPDALATLMAHLVDRNFLISSDEKVHGFGDRMVILSRSPLSVRIVADRDQWFIELGLEEWGDWFDPDVWRACLESSQIPDESRSLIQQASFVVSEIERIVDGERKDAGRLLQCLRERRAARSSRRLGFR